ncbi:MAG: hypothetical protein EBU90_28865 [Proteobacteria bacterium]|nr:hypothetical protein [Pseudomonadota bacterium]
MFLDGLKVNFKNSDRVNLNYSQCFQDVFALIINNGKEEGSFLDLGCSFPETINNTFLLEKRFNWKGLSYDLHEPAILEFNKNRNTKAFIKDCTKLDFDYIINELGSNIDYLSLDLEPAQITLKCLESIPFDRISFNAITFEHDKYRFGPEVQARSRDIFLSNGYSLIVGDVSEPIENSFEDWYAGPNIDLNRLSPLIRSRATSKDALFN